MTIPSSTIVLSVVAPVFNDEECLEELHRRVSAVSSSLTDRHEIVLVDDGSSDGSWTGIEALSRIDPRVRGIRLSLLLGQHFAIHGWPRSCPRRPEWSSWTAIFRNGLKRSRSSGTR